VVEKKAIRPQTRVLALLPLAAFFFGCLEYGPARGPEPGSVLSTIHAVSSLAIVGAWFLMDARARGYRASIALKAAMLVITVVALPYYLVRSRGAASGLKALAWAVLVFATTMIAYRLGSWFA
jgi:hypothetical protein